MGSYPLSWDFSILDSHRRSVVLSSSKSVLSIQQSTKYKLKCPFAQVLWSEVTVDHRLHVSLLRRVRKRFALYTVTGTFDAALHNAAEEWSQSLMKAVYEGCQPRRKFKIVINPCGGSGKALSVFEKRIKPIFEAANSTFDVMVTTHNGHCYEYVKSMPLEYDAIVVLSGDGLVHEVFNAFADRVDSKVAFTMPVVQIPTGSGNGFSIALLGLKDGLDVSAAALNAIKGKQMKLDLCSVLQDGKRSISFMSQAIGMMADIDLGTEKLRWMGDTRFMLGFLWHVGINRKCSMKLEMKVVARDKEQMVRTYRSTRSLAGFTETQSENTYYKGSLPETENTEAEADEWTVIDEDLSYIYAGKLPYVSRDLMQFPLALCDDGLIDIVVQEKASRMVFFKGLEQADKGKQYWEPTQLYFKAKAYRLTPHEKEGYLSLDGERYPYTPFEVEVQQSMGTTLGKGGWNVEFNE